jgi:hypothetical protein
MVMALQVPAAARGRRRRAMAVRLIRPGTAPRERRSEQGLRGPQLLHPGCSLVPVKSSAHQGFLRGNATVERLLPCQLPPRARGAGDHPGPSWGCGRHAHHLLDVRIGLWLLHSRPYRLRSARSCFRSRSSPPGRVGPAAGPPARPLSRAGRFPDCSRRPPVRIGPGSIGKPGRAPGHPGRRPGQAWDRRRRRRGPRVRHERGRADGSIARTTRA